MSEFREPSMISFDLAVALLKGKLPVDEAHAARLVAVGVAENSFVCQVKGVEYTSPQEAYDRERDFLRRYIRGDRFPSPAAHEGFPYNVEMERNSFDRWVQSLAEPVTGAVPTVSHKSQREKEVDRSYAKNDAPLIAKMHEMIINGEARTPSAAALHFVDEAVGGGAVVSKQRRLQRGYEKTYGAT